MFIMWIVSKIVIFKRGVTRLKKNCIDISVPFMNFMMNLFSVNKRLDDWVPESFLDTRKVQFPRRDGTTTGQNTGVTTPRRFATSPRTDGEGEVVNGSSVMAAALHKKMNRKRKVIILLTKIFILKLNRFVCRSITADQHNSFLFPRHVTRIIFYMPILFLFLP